MLSLTLVNIMAIAQNFIEPVYLPRTVLVYPDSLAYYSSYLLSEAFHQIHQTCFDYWASLSETQTFYHYIDFPFSEVDLVATLPSMHFQYPNSNSYQSSPMIPVVSHVQQHRRTTLDYLSLCLLTQPAQDEVRSGISIPYLFLSESCSMTIATVDQIVAHTLASKGFPIITW